HEVHGHLSHTQVTIATTIVVVLGAGLGWFLFRNGTDPVPRAAAWPVRFARADLGGEAVNRGLFERPSRLAASASVAMDGRVVDGAVNGLAAGVGGTSRRLLLVQTGFVRSYALSILSGAVIVVAALMVVVVQ
ncbi:MAG TPA: NADH-quinone oxidoreductase subunit L, partial [Glycomyces sp.]